ncbi:hypothetical protein AN958_00542 [Leucoagaricus sp. SymC.cos]|nr:hypothetical protein AN958_00542 [Leucoagaricus sp. SymC.cos]
MSPQGYSKLPFALNTPLPSTASAESLPNATAVPKMRNAFEQSLMTEFGAKAHHFYVSDELLDQAFTLIGIPPEDLKAKREWYDDRMNSMVDKNGHARIIGLKPRPGERVYLVDLSSVSDNPNLSVRFFDGGLDNQGAFVFDFYDCKTFKAVNSSPDWRVSIVPVVGTMSFLYAGLLRSWEAEEGIRPENIKPGEERFSVPEGVTLELELPGGRKFRFTAPIRHFDQVASPVANVQPH